MLGDKLEGKRSHHHSTLVAELIISRVSVDDELNLVLLRLVQYLGHVNPIVSGVAFNEVWAYCTVIPHTANIFSDLCSGCCCRVLSKTTVYSLLAKRSSGCYKGSTYPTADSSTNGRLTCNVHTGFLENDPILYFTLASSFQEERYRPKDSPSSRCNRSLENLY